MTVPTPQRTACQQALCISICGDQSETFPFTAPTQVPREFAIVIADGLIRTASDQPPCETKVPHAQSMVKRGVPTLVPSVDGRTGIEQ